MTIRFWKMHGAGNDFILVDDRSLVFPAADGAWMASIADRRRGVGCDGVALLQPSSRADFRMRFFNPDGREAEMCGNGARCMARLAAELGVARENMTIETGAGLLRARLGREGVSVQLTPPTGWRLGGRFDIDGAAVDYDFVNTGVPHVVIRVPDAARADLARLGPAFRRHSAFAPAGTNVNVISVAGPGRLQARTYERGVEAETLACGTGAAAAALVAARRGWARPPVSVITASGDTLTIAFELAEDGARDVWLTGPAEHVFQGAIEYRPAGEQP